MTFLPYFCFLLLHAFGTPAASGDVGALPPDGFLKTWTRSENARVFTSSDLYGFIDGGAEIFLEFGFETLTVQPYRPAGAGAQDMTEFQIEIYRMTDPTAAAGIYLMNCGKEAPDPSFEERHTINQFQLLFRRGRYYVVVNNLEGNEALRPAMLEFARYIASRLPAGKPVTPGAALPPEGLDPGSVRLVRGTYGLQSIYTLGEGDILMLGRSLTAVSGKYRTGDATYTLIQADYPTAEAAGKTFANIQAHLDSYLKVEEKSASRLTFKDYDGEYGEIRLASRRVSIRVHLKSKP